MRWFNRYNFPYSNFHDLNLDWIIKEMNRLIEEWEVLKAEWEQMKIEWVEFQAEMQRLWQEYQDLMNAAWEAYKANLNEEWATYQNNLNNAWAAFQDAMNDWKNSVDQDIQDKFDEIDAKCAECLARVQAALDNLNNVLAEVQQQVTEYLENLPYQTIIHDTTIEWLDEHGVTVSSAFLTPEEFGAVGDGTTDDKAAFIELIRESAAQGKAISLGAGKIYFLSSYAYQLPQNTVIYGNGATMLFEGQGSDSILYVNAYNVIRDLRVVGNGISSYSNSIDGLYLENIFTNNLKLNVNNPSATNVHLKSIDVQNSFSLGQSIGSNYNGKDFVIEDLTLNEDDASINGNGFIRGLKTNQAYNPVTVNITSLGPGIIFESYDRININKFALSGTYKEAQYTTV